MTAAGVADDLWLESNQRSLVAEVNRIRDLLLHHTRHTDKDKEHPRQSPPLTSTGKREAGTVPAPSLSALEILCQRFGLSGFERDVLLLCAGIELDSSFAVLCASAQDDPARTYPTFSLALAVLPDPHWNALSPAAPLRYWRLIETGQGPSLTAGPLRIDERILHFLTGIQYTDERLNGYVVPCQDDIGQIGLVPSHKALADRVVAVWRDAAHAGHHWPIIQLCGSDAAGVLDIAYATCSAMGLGVYVIPAQSLPTSPTDLEALVRLCDREAILTSCVYLIQCDDSDPSDLGRQNTVTRVIEAMRTPLLIGTREMRPVGLRSSFSLIVNRPETGEQRDLWQILLKGSQDISGENIDTLVSQFNLSTRMIRDAGNRYLSASNPGNANPGLQENSPYSVLWDTCRKQTRTQIADLAQPIRPAAVWDDLVLPPVQKETLRTIATQVRQRMKVYGTWGFGAKSARGLGISALFAGASGTGKTMAAEVLAHELALDLYRIDLSQVVSKYIGETEKNLRRVFDAAEEGGAILLFDEADALFGKRSEVRDSHDRYANIEVSYLLQRMEEYRGLAILTTNMKDALDPAFLRRIRFFVHFPFPDERNRAMIWERVFPDKTPRQGIDTAKLARLNVPGGNIHNIALAAAFLAAEDGGIVGMGHLLRAAQAEYSKMERTLSEAETGGWI